MAPRISHEPTRARIRPDGLHATSRPSLEYPKSPCRLSSSFFSGGWYASHPRSPCPPSRAPASGRRLIVRRSAIASCVPARENIPPTQSLPTWLVNSYGRDCSDSVEAVRKFHRAHWHAGPCRAGSRTAQTALWRHAHLERDPCDPARDPT